MWFYRRFWRAVLAEILGSLIFVSAVLGSSIPNQAQDCSILLLQPALAAGFTAVGLGHCFGDISGAQVNPAVTLAFLATRKLDILRTASYIIGQCLGATMAAGILYLTIPLKSAARCYVNMINPESNAGQALGMEVLATFQLVFTIFSVEDHRRREVGEPGNLAIGFSLSAGILTGHISGGSMNPARSLGPAIITGYWEHHWVRSFYKLRLMGLEPEVMSSCLEPEVIKSVLELELRSSRPEPEVMSSGPGGISHNWSAGKEEKGLVYATTPWSGIELPSFKPFDCFPYAPLSSDPVRLGIPDRELIRKSIRVGVPRASLMNKQRLIRL
uniref:Aquaporin-4-like n=1 Tax=Erpetoichthys calabaricus TaxID=27687 RepID=A0A8C4SXJ1_ERPCA